jgi:molecular chaperone GrpE
MSAKKKSKIDIATSDEVDAYGESAGTKVDTSTTTQTEQTDDVTKLRQELEEMTDKLLRTKAEMQNVMKRSATQMANAVRFANADLIKALLDTIDDLERTLDQSQTSDPDAIRKAVQMIYDKFMKALVDQSVETIDPVGEAFDPHFHEAVLQQPAPDKEPGTIITVLQRGFKLADRVLRPAKVIVASAEQRECESSNEAAG